MFEITLSKGIQSQPAGPHLIRVFVGLFVVCLCLGIYRNGGQNEWICGVIQETYIRIGTSIDSNCLLENTTILFIASVYI